MAIQNKGFLTSPAVSVVTGSNIIEVTGSVDCSYTVSGTAVILDGGSYFIEAVSGTSADPSGISTITLRNPFDGPTLTDVPMTVFNTTEGLRDAIRRARDISISSSEVQSIFGEVLLSTDETITVTINGVEEEITPYGYLLGQVQQTIIDLQSTLDTLGTASERDVGESTGNLIEVGSFGIGGAIKYNTSQNFNLFTTSGEYAFTALSNENAPTTNRFFLKVLAYTSGQAIQTATSILSGNLKEVYKRWYNRTGEWTPWVKIYHTENIVGSVSRSGNTPTGAIIEKGSNVNGNYTKFADGTLICTFKRIGTGLSVSNSYGSLFIGDFGWTYPAIFVNTPVIHSSFQYSTGASWSSVLLGSSNNSSSTIRLLDVFSRDGTSVSYLDVFAIGRWY